jgi:hypothetical protein
MKKAKLLSRSILFLIFFACSSEQIDEESITPIQYKLTIKASEGGTITPDANGMYNEGATITVTASPNDGYKFNRWKGTDIVSCGNRVGLAGPGKCRTIITMDSDRDVQAFFEKIK